jgi:hydrogenase nickel incorporation protein HypB
MANPKSKISIVENILNSNDQIALQNRARLDNSNVIGMNFMASPGAGKTSLIEATLDNLKNTYKIAVIDGDVATSIDADRAANAGAQQAVQVNTGGQCHLDAVMVSNALNQLDLVDIDLLIVENVGNLICPSSFQLGTHKNVLISSIPEGDDKPYKYPQMYQNIDALVLNKIDLIPFVDFNIDYFLNGVGILNPGLINFQLSCRTKDGIEEWLEWVESNL